MGIDFNLLNFEVNSRTKMAGGLNPMHSDLLSQHNAKKQQEKQIDFAAMKLAIDTRGKALELAISATPPDELTPEVETTDQRQNRIYSRALQYESFMVYGRDMFKKNEEKKQDKENGDTSPVQEETKPADTTT